MRTRTKLTATCAVAAVSAMSLVGIPAANANIADAPIINEFVTDTQGVDMLEYVEVLVPENYDTSNLHILGVEGDDNNNQGTAVHSYSLGDLAVDEDGRLLLTTPVNGLQNAALTLALTNGEVSTGTALDEDLDGELEAPDGVEILDVVGINDGRSGAMAWGTELSASQFDGYTGTLGGASRIPDASDTWVPNAYNGAGLDHERAADAPRGEFEAWNTPGEVNEIFSEEDDGSEPDPEPTEPTDPTDPEEPTEPGEICEADFTLISEIQGVGQGTDMDGDTVTVQGVVTGDFTNNSGTQNGFYIQQQEDDYDGNPATSEGIFVYDQNGTAPDPGTLVAVEGEADEYYDMTQIQSDEIVECGEAPLPEPLDVTFPIDETAFAGMESMRVNVEEAVVLETYQFGRYGETVVGPERQFQPTAIHSPESAEAEALYESNMANRIKIDDRRSDQNPDPAMHLNGEEFTVDNYFRGGDTFRDITGVLDYRFDEWKIQQTEGAEHVPNLERPEVPDVGGDVSVAAFNVLNYFTTMGSRGANDAEEFERQETKIVSAILEMDADVMGLMEIENNDDVAVNTLVDALNERAGEERYTALETGQLGTDEITTAIIYQDDTVEPVGDFEVLDETVDERFDTARHRPALAQTFTPVAEADDADEILDEFTVVTNHLKSKGSECGSEGDNTHLVGSCDAERTSAAAAMVDWVDAEDMPNPVITGDLNAYDQEAPITTLEDGGYVDLREHFDGEEAYSYVFDGQLGYLDYIMAGDELMPFITGAASWHANSDEVPIFDYTTRFKQPAQQAIYEPGPYRASDHDPVIFGLSLTEVEDEEEPEDPVDPVDPEDPSEPELSIDPERISLEHFMADTDGDDTERGVLLHVDGLDVDQQVNFTVTPGNDNIDSFEHTAAATEDGVAEWRVTGEATDEPEDYIGNYDVEVTLDDSSVIAPFANNDGNLLTGSFEVYAEDNGTETPVDPEDPEVIDPALTVSPERISADEFVIDADGDDTGRGVLVQVDGLDPDQEVTFTVTPEHGNVEAYKETTVTDDDGVATWQIVGTNTDAPQAYVGNYDVTASYGSEDDELLTGSFEVYAVDDSGAGFSGPQDGTDQTPSQLGNAADPNGYLADTGANTALVLTAVAAFLLLVGGALVYGKRRGY